MRFSNFLLNHRTFSFLLSGLDNFFYVCLPEGDHPNYVYWGGGGETSSGGGADPPKKNRASRGSKRDPRDVSIDLKSRPPPLQNPEYAPAHSIIIKSKTQTSCLNITLVLK